MTTGIKSPMTVQECLLLQPWQARVLLQEAWERGLPKQIVDQLFKLV